MLEIKTLEVAGVAGAVSALRLPFGKDCRSKVSALTSVDAKNRHIITTTDVIIDEKDLSLMENLVKSGDEHSKVVRSIVVYAEIAAPIWFYRELETYRIGRERLSCESTMHIECRGLSGAELEKAKDSISMGHIQRTVDMFSYQTLRRIYFQRRNHRLPMWHDFCKWVETLPFAKELLLCSK